MQNVLISYPSWDQEQIYLPYIFGLLKTFCDRDSRLSNHLNWLMPVYGQNTPDEMLRGYDLSSVDVLGLSCYSWNWFLQREIARRVRRANPDCLIVAGGPHCDYEDPDFFREHPWLDVVVKQDGQIPFREILRHRVDGQPALASIPGLYLPDEDGVPTLTAPPELLAEEDIPETSPYQEQSDYFQPMLEEAREVASCVWGIFETNRGCPYHCSFCDWGSLTFSKVRKYPMSRVRKDIRWLTSNRVPALYLADANVGIFERDIEIMDFLGRQKQKHGKPHDMIFSLTKSRAPHLPSIMRKTYEYELKARACFPLQHTHPEVLDAMDRTNLQQGEIDELQELAHRKGIPVYVQLILGSPNDSYERWKQCFSDLMSMGIDGDYFVFDFEVLPNAPAAREDYREEWDIETTTMKVISSETAHRSDSPPNTALRNIITSTSTFDEDDWCRMWVYTHVLRAFHSMDLTRKLALYLHYFEGVSFTSFYEGIVEELGADEGTLLGQCLQRIHLAKQQFLQDPTFPHQMVEPDEIPDYDFRIYWRDWLVMKCASRLERFYGEVEDWLMGRFAADTDRLRDLLGYQRNIVVTPDYESGELKTFDADYDWKGYFERPRNELQQAPVSGPWRFVIQEEHLGPKGDASIDWDQFKGEMRLESWFKTVVRWAQRRPADLTTHEVQRIERPAFPRRVWNRARRSFDSLLSRSPSVD